MPCYSSNQSLPAADLDDGAATIYFISLANQSTVRITFTVSTGESITSVSCSPRGPSTGSDWVEFGTSHLDTFYTVTVTYTGSGRSTDLDGTPLVTPTKYPKFKPVNSCP